MIHNEAGLIRMFRIRRLRAVALALPLAACLGLVAFLAIAGCKAYFETPSSQLAAFAAVLFTTAVLATVLAHWVRKVA